MLFSEPKIPQSCRATRRRQTATTVSVLFSEPKIPQIDYSPITYERQYLFQCSSASRKFLKPHARARALDAQSVSVLFSEPKIPQTTITISAIVINIKFQCSSASRKFLKSVALARRAIATLRFSALQRAENSSNSRARSSA